GDHTAWSRLEAVTLKERTYEHQAQPMSGSKPVTLGQGYSSIVWVPQTEGSWALPLLHERITSFTNPIEKAAAQLRQVCLKLPKRPLTLWDAEYGCASFVKQTADIAADKLFRLRSNRLLYGKPVAYTGIGRPRIHGDKFKLNDPQTWWTPDQLVEVKDLKLGLLRLRLWRNLHFQQSANNPMHLVQVERLNEDGVLKSRPLWLAWMGIEMPQLCEFWQLYLRRFAVDHWYRFAKQRLHWTLPKLSTPEQCERWSDLLPLMTWQLWLARDIVTDNPLPWQKPQAKMTPGRVAAAMGGVLPIIGTPSVPPKPRGKSPGWPAGKARLHRIRYPTVKKGTTKRKKEQPKSA
uniref:transposase n=1 Tax=Scytonema sp. PCC 10023 TaxID=1680591 RepID=UPI0039C70839